MGGEADLGVVESKINNLIKYIDKYNSLTEGNVMNILNKSEDEMFFDSSADEVIVYGNKGHVVKARTVNQRKMVDSILENESSRAQHICIQRCSVFEPLEHPALRSR